MTPGRESRELLWSRFIDFSYISILDSMCQNFAFFEFFFKLRNRSQFYFFTLLQEKLAVAPLFFQTFSS